MKFFGHVPLPDEPEPKIFASFAAPEPEKRETLLHMRELEVTGKQMPYGHQRIGDCVSWAWSHLVNYTAILSGQEYEPCATEVIYALSRVEVGGRRFGNSDGSTGKWAGDAVRQFGTLSRKALERCGLPSEYDPSRAKVWGYQGLPDNLEPEARKYVLQDVTRVSSFMEAAYHIENQRPVAVCSDVGFENGPRGITQRDADGFASPAGEWQHAMTFVAVRWDRPGLLCLNQWQDQLFAGPQVKGQPHKSFWVDAKVADHMLRQQDSYTGSGLQGFPINRPNWSH